MARMNVAHFKAARSLFKPPGPKRGQTAFVRQLSNRIGLIHELRKLRSAEEIFKNAGKPFCRNNFPGVRVSEEKSKRFILSLMIFSIRAKPMRHWFWINSPTERTRRLPSDRYHRQKHLSSPFFKRIRYLRAPMTSSFRKSHNFELFICTSKPSLRLSL